MTRRDLLQLLAAVAAAAALDRWLPPFGEPALRATVAFAPVPLALFAALGRRLPAARARGAEILTGLLLLAAALRGEALGLPFSTPLLAAAGALWLGHRTLRLALALRRRLARDRRPRQLAPFVLLPLAVYLAALPWVTALRPPDGDEPYYLLLAHSLAEDFDIDLADEYRDEVWRAFSRHELEPQPGDPVGPGGEVFSRHEPLLPLLLAPFYAAGGVVGARALLAALAALAAGRLLAAALAQPGVTARGAFRAWALFAFAPPLLVMCHQIWVEVPAALAVVLVIEARARLRATRGRTRPGDWLRLALPLAALPLLKLRLLLVAAPLALLVVTGLRRSRRLQVALVIGFLALVATLLTVNQLAYGNPLKMHSVEELAPSQLPIERILRGGVGLFFDHAFGLVAAAPLWLLAVPAALLVLRRREPLSLELAAFAPYLLAVASRREWYGGWSPPFRYGLVFLPVLALSIAHLASRPRGATHRALAAALVGATALLGLAALAVPGWTYTLADGGSQLMSALGGRFDADLLRLLPSAVRPSAATWIVPLAAVGLALVATRVRAARPRRAAAWGVAALLAGWALLLIGAHRLPTRAIELEDPWVARQGTLVYPERWIIDRTRFRGGALLPEGASASARPVPGGREVTLTLEWSVIRNDDTPIALEVLAGEARLAHLAPRTPGVWQRTTLGPYSWTAGTRLTFRTLAPEGAPPKNGFVIDRAELVWR